MGEKRESERWYPVVEVTGVRGGRGTAVIDSVHDTYEQAVDHARKRPDRVALSTPYVGVKPEPGAEHFFEVGKHPGLDQALRELRWQREHKQPVLVCRMDGRHGIPEPNMEVRYDCGRDEHCRAREFTARPISRVHHDHRSEDTYYVPVERYGGIRPEGKVLGVYRSRAEAWAHTRTRIEEIAASRQHVQDSGPDALRTTSFGPEARPIAKEHQHPCADNQQTKPPGIPMGR